MPELPEVETIRRTLGRRITRRRVEAVTLHRADVVRGQATAAALGADATVQSLERHGKQLAITTDGPCLCIHLGMSGSLRLLGTDQTPPPHTHVTWLLTGGQRLVFADARRFGGVWTFPSLAALHQERWSSLGPDARDITPGRLHAALSRTVRAIKAALLDQQLVAGLGNIYVDELLFRCRIHPLTPGCQLAAGDVRRLVGVMRRILTAAINAGGTTLRNYVDGSGQSGRWQDSRQVHGQSGKVCRRCGKPLTTLVVGGRTTVCCPACQAAPDGLL